MKPRLRVGVSACLLGDHVRYDGGHKRADFLIDLFGPFVEWVKVCPEAESGMGTPREPVRLVRQDGRLRLLTVHSGIDRTSTMMRYAGRRVRELDAEQLCGYVLKKDSPSCGLERVKVYRGSRPPTRSGTGLFAEALLARFPDLPIEEEGRLSDADVRENFVERMLAYRRLAALFNAQWTRDDLVAFHTAHKLVLMSHSPHAGARLGRLAARAKRIGRSALRDEYRTAFLEALAIPATRQRHTNVLRHVVRAFTRELDADARAKILDTIEAYQHGRAPLTTPLELIRHHARQQRLPYLAGQVYLQSPHPAELMRRTHAQFFQSPSHPISKLPNDQITEWPDV